MLENNPNAFISTRFKFRTLGFFLIYKVTCFSFSMSLDVGVRVHFNGLREAKSVIAPTIWDSMREEMMIMIQRTDSISSTDLLKREILRSKDILIIMNELKKCEVKTQITLICRGQHLTDQILAKLVEGEVVHCLVTPLVRETSSTVEEQPVYRGFDRLREMGFGETDISNMRQQFRRSDLSTTEMLNLEEEWLENQHDPQPIPSPPPQPVLPPSVRSAVTSSSITVDIDQGNSDVPVAEFAQKEMFFCLLLGFFFGVMSVIYLLIPRSARHQRYRWPGMVFSVVLGISGNIIMNLSASNFGRFGK